MIHYTWIWEWSYSTSNSKSNRNEISKIYQNYLRKNSEIMQVTTNYPKRLAVFPEHVFGNLKSRTITLIKISIWNHQETTLLNCTYLYKVQIVLLDFTLLILGREAEGEEKEGKGANSWARTPSAIREIRAAIVLGPRKLPVMASADDVIVLPTTLGFILAEAVATPRDRGTE